MEKIQVREKQFSPRVSCSFAGVLLSTTLTIRKGSGESNIFLVNG